MFEAFVSVVLLYFIFKFIYRIVYACIDMESRRVQLKTQRQANRHMREQQKRMMEQQAAAAQVQASANADVNARAAAFLADAKTRQL